MAKLIEVEERDLNYIFGKSKPYSLDVYQRDYRWSDGREYKIVTQLLADIELRFEHNMKHKRRNQSDDLSRILKDVEGNFDAYFLNTIMLNEQGGNIYIVDGQQRLTTLLLLLIKLYHIGISNPTGGMNIFKLIGEKIFEEDLAGAKHFKISNEDRNAIIKKIFEQDDICQADLTNLTQSNLNDNYLVIARYFDKYFFNKDGEFDRVKYNYYVYNLLLKVLIIEQVIKHKEDVAMIFETANDRGKELDSHEVLKGLLLGVLDIDEKERCNTVWNDALKTFYSIYGNYQNVDEFFRTYFRSKYADNQNQYESFSGKYHRSLLSNSRIIRDLDRSMPEKIEKFIKNEFKYFYKTFLEIIEIAEEEKDLNVASNYANERGQQHLLILSALSYNDPEKDKKISLVARKLDQFYTISRLVGIYDSNDQQKEIYEINKSIRGKSLREIESEFNKIIVAHFNSKNLPITEFNEIFQYKYFQNAKIDGRFTKYILARVDRYLADILNEQSFAKQEKLHFIVHSGAKPTNGFHIEHMYAMNEKIMNQFKDREGHFDELLFTEQRNRLGAVILLKGNENIRTSNWLYKRKMTSYSNSGFVWNRILTNSINTASLNNCQEFVREKFKSYQPDAEGLLTRDAIEERQQLLFELIKNIYAN